ncbi:hypothetical protein Aperf_G00000117100 [Anoplocephala perfoliata]
MTPGPSLRLNNGHTIPRLGFGTFNVDKEVVSDAIKGAFEAGFRHIDCAPSYENEKEVGQGIAKSMKKFGLRREDIFVTSKLGCDHHDPKDVRKACEESLRNLGLDYLDLYLIQWPVPFHFKKFDANDPTCLIFDEHRIEDTWSEMEKLVTAGLVKSIGVSNFNKRQVEHIIRYGKIVPAVNQVEVNLHWLNTKLIEFCQSKNIQIVGYSILGTPTFLKNQANPILHLKAVGEIAKVYNVTPVQVVVRHGLQRNIAVLVTSVITEEIRSGYDVFGFELSEDEMNRLNKVGLNYRLVEAIALANHPDYPFYDEY